MYSMKHDNNRDNWLAYETWGINHTIVLVCLSHGLSGGIGYLLRFCTSKANFRGWGLYGVAGYPHEITVLPFFVKNP